MLKDTITARVHLGIGDELVPVVVQVPRYVRAYSEEARERVCANAALRALLGFMPLVPPGADTETATALEAWEGRGEEP